MEDFNFIEQPDENIIIDDINDLEENIINNNIIIINNNINNNNNNKENSWINILNLLGLYNMNYPLKNIQNGIVEMHIEKTNSNHSSRYSRNLKFKDDNISKKLEEGLFNKHSYPPYSQVQIYRQLTRIYRHYKYDKIINVVDRKEDKKDAIGFSNDNPRWNALETEWL